MSRACPQVSKFSKSLPSDHSVSSFLIETGQASRQTDGHDPTLTESAVEWKDREKKLTTLVCIPWGSTEFSSLCWANSYSLSTSYIWGVCTFWCVCQKRTPSWYRWPWSIGHHLTGTDQCGVRKAFTSEYQPCSQMGPYICWRVSFSTGNCRVGHSSPWALVKVTGDKTQYDSMCPKGRTVWPDGPVAWSLWADLWSGYQSRCFAWKFPAFSIESAESWDSVLHKPGLLIPSYCHLGSLGP